MQEIGRIRSESTHVKETLGYNKHTCNQTTATPKGGFGVQLVWSIAVSLHGQEAQADLLMMTVEGKLTVGFHWHH